MSSNFWEHTAEGAGVGAGLGSIIPGVGTLIGGVLGGISGAAFGAGEDYIDANKPALKSPDSASKAPTREQTNTTAIQKQLASESAARRYGSYMNTFGGHVGTPIPTAASTLLLGS
jgi:phage tail tape-measure protein